MLGGRVWGGGSSVNRPAESARQKKGPMALRKVGGGGGSRLAENASGKNGRKRPSEKMSDGIAEGWEGAGVGGGEPTGQKRQ